MIEENTEPAVALEPGAPMPDLALPDHTGRERRLSELGGGDPIAVNFFRGWWCPKEQRYFRELARLQDEFEVAYTRLVSISVEPPEISSAFRAGLGARWTFLSDAQWTWQGRLGLLEGTDTVHRPYRPTVLTLTPDLTIHSVYHGYWYWGRATMEELRRDMRAICSAVRVDWTGA